MKILFSILFIVICWFLIDLAIKCCDKLFKKWKKSDKCSADDITFYRKDEEKEHES